MSGNPIDRILAERGPKSSPPSGEPNEAEAAKSARAVEEHHFFAIIRGEGVNEDFLEFQLRNGNRVCFPYNGVNWFNFDPKEGCIDMDFGSAIVTIKGRGFLQTLWPGLKSKRVAWIKEADSEMQDNPQNEAFVASVQIAPAGGGDEGEKDVGQD